MSDGSRIDLNTNSAVIVDYKRRERTVRLLHGEALFHVEGNPARPFVVTAESGVVRALGTTFSVRLTQEDVIVTVAEGVVEFSSRLTAVNEAAGQVDDGDRTEAAKVLLSEGETSSIAQMQSGAKRALDDASLRHRLAWTRGELAFQQETLSFVVEEVARYTPVRIVVVDEELKDLEITGIFVIGDVEVMLEGIKASLGVKVIRVSDDLIHISSG